MGIPTCACICLAVFSCVGARAQNAISTQSSSATATFAYLSDDDCVQNEVEVFASRTTVTSASGPPPSMTATYSRHRFDICENIDLGADIGATGHGTFTADLDRASLSATIGGVSPSGARTTINIALEWAGRGATVQPSAAPSNQIAGKPKVTRGSASRSAVARGTVDGIDVSDAAVGASLHLEQHTVSR